MNDYSFVLFLSFITDNENNEGLGSASTSADKVDETQALPPLSEQLNLDELWDTLSACLTELAHTQDSHAVLVLQVS